MPQNNVEHTGKGEIGELRSGKVYGMSHMQRRACFPKQNSQGPHVAEQKGRKLNNYAKGK
jgi:hypothetical protein